MGSFGSQVSLCLDCTLTRCKACLIHCSALPSPDLVLAWSVFVDQLNESLPGVGQLNESLPGAGLSGRSRNQQAFPEGSPAPGPDLYLLNEGFLTPFPKRVPSFQLPHLL